jgi:hypothetical protein
MAGTDGLMRLSIRAKAGRASLVLGATLVLVASSVGGCAGEADGDAPKPTSYTMKADLCSRLNFSQIGETIDLSPGEQADTGERVACRVTLTDKKSDPPVKYRLDLLAQAFSSAEGARTEFNKGAAQYDGKMRGDSGDVTSVAEATRYYRDDKAGYATIAVDANLYLDMRLVLAEPPATAMPRLNGDWPVATKLVDQVVAELRRPAG